MKKVLFILLGGLSFFVISCSKPLPDFISGKPGVQFTERELKRNFNFSKVAVQESQDTVWLSVRPQGTLLERTSYIRLEAFNETRWDYLYDEKGNKVDSTLYEYPDQAEVGKHYIGFNDERVSRLMKLEVGEFEARIPVILLRDPSLKDKTYTLNIKIVDSEDFRSGDPKFLTAKIMIADKLSKPVKWDTYFWAGIYGEEKHTFMIRVSGEPWDDDFLDKLTHRNEKNFYLILFNRELKKENEERLANNQEVLKEKDGTEVAFPTSWVDY